MVNPCSRLVRLSDKIYQARKVWFISLSECDFKIIHRDVDNDDDDDDDDDANLSLIHTNLITII